MTIGGATLQDGGGGGSTTTINNGAITVAASGSLTLGGFTNPETFSNSGGSITNNGAITMRNLATFIQRGGSETGIPVALNSGSTLDDDVSAAAAGFVIPESDATLTGSGSNPGLAAGQVLTVAANYTQATLGKSLTNAGTLILGDAGSGFSILCCAGVTLTNTGHLNTLAGAGGNRHLRANIINAGGLVDIAGPTLQDVHRQQQGDGDDRTRPEPRPQRWIQFQPAVNRNIRHCDRCQYDGLRPVERGSRQPQRPAQGDNCWVSAAG